MIRRKTLCLLFAVLTIFLISPYEKSSAEYEHTASEITGINVERVGGATEVQIETSSPSFSYTIYSPEDPFRVVLELQGLDLGKFQDNDTMVIDKEGVSEIVFSKVEGIAHAIRLDITLSTPTKINPVKKGKTLVLAFRNPEIEEAPDELAAAETVKPDDASLANAKTIENIEVTKAGNKIDFLIHGDGAMTPKVFEIEGNKLVLDIPGVTPKFDSYKAFEPPVSGVRIGKDPDKTRIVFDMMRPSPYNVSTEAKLIRVSFEKPDMKTASAELPVPEKQVPVIAEQRAAEDKAAPYTSKEYTGEKISLDFQDADLLHIFRLIADVSGYNIVVSPQVAGKFSMKLINVPWDQAFDIILRNYGLSKAVEGNVIRVAPTAVIAQEEEDIAKAKDAALKSGDLETRLYKINYADVTKLQIAVKDIMSQRGKLSIDERTSTVILKDVENTHKEFARLMNALDVPTAQVNIEAKIVEVSTNFEKDLGIQWGVLWRPPDSRTTIGGPGIPPGTGFSSGNPLMVNLPAAVTAGKGGALGIGYISASQVFSLDLQLSALESSGKGKIISNPRITTLDMQSATIKQGTEVPYLGAATTAGTAQDTKFKEAVLELTVTPQITPDGSIIMDLLAKNDTVDPSVSTAGEAGPPISKKEIKSKVLIKDGDTLVVGGIYKTTTSKSKDGIPGLSKIPLFGRLFRRDVDKEDTSELLIFITPRVVKNF